MPRHPEASKAGPPADSRIKALEGRSDFPFPSLFSAMALSFPKSVRLVRSGEFARVRTKGRTFGGRYMVLSLLKLKPEEAQAPRFGFITSRRVGGAVQCNRVRRRLRELVRQHRPRLPEGIWLVIIARYTAASASYEELAREWKRLARRAELL